MRAQLRPAFVLFLLCAGCGTLRNVAQTGRPCDGLLSLSNEEIRFAGALSHYAQGLIYEDSFGGKSPDRPGDLAEAVTNFSAALALDPETPRLYCALAISHLALKESDKAIETLRKACERSPESSLSWIDLAVACEKSGRPEESIIYFNRAIKLAPQKEYLYRELALIYFQLKKNREALALLKKAIRYAVPADSIASFCYNLGKLYESVGMEDNAVECYKLAGASNTPWPDPFIRMAVIYMRKDISKAIRTIDRAIESTPDEPKLLFLLALMYCNDNQFEKAISTFQRTERNAGKAGQDNEQISLTPVFYLNYGSAYERVGQYSKAEEVFKKCLNIYPDSHEVLNYLAYMWAERGEKLDEGLNCINKAISLSPDNGAYLDTLGWIYYKQKKYDIALEKTQKASELMPNDPTIIEHLGDIYLALNDKPKALSLWKQSFTIDQKNKSAAAKLTQNGLSPRQILKELEDRLKKESSNSSEKNKEGKRTN